MAKPTKPNSISSDERRARSRLHQLLHQADGFLHGSIIEMNRRCGNPRCRCATDDDSKHRSLYLGQTLKGKTSMQYIPKDFEPTVRRWVDDFQTASNLLESISQQGHLRFKSAKEARAARKLSISSKKASKKKASRGTARKTPSKKLAAKKKSRKKKTSTSRKSPS